MSFWDGYQEGSGGVAGYMKKTMPAPAPQKKGSFLTRNLDTAGGIGGGLAGAAAGGAIGSVVPIVGTGVGAVLGGLIGAFGGGAAGKAGSQALQGEKLNTGEILKAGAINGAGELIGGGIGTIGAKVLPKLLSKGAAPVTDFLANKTAGNVTKQIASNLPTNSLKTGRDIGSLYEKSGLAANIGLYGNKARETAAKLVTGSNGVVNGIKQQVLAQSGHVPILDNLDNTVMKALSENGVAGMAEKKAVRNAVRAQVEKAAGPGGAIGEMSVTADKAFKAQQALEGLAASARTAGKPEIAKAYQAVAKGVGEQIDTHAGANAAVAGFKMSSDQANHITALATKQLGKAKGSRLAQYVIDGVNNAKSIPELRKIEANFIPGATAATAATAKGLQKGMGDAIETGSEALMSPYGKFQFGKMVGQKISGLTTPVIGEAARVAGKVEPAIPQVLQRVAGQSGAGRMAAGPATAALAEPAPAVVDQNVPQGPNDYALQSNSIFDQSSGQPDAASPYSEKSMLSDIQRDPKHISEYMALYKQLNPEQKNAAQPGYGKPSASQYSQGVSGLQSIDQLEQMLQSDRGVIGRNATPGQGLPLVGSLESGVLGTSDYRAVSHNILNSIARINTGAAMPAKEEAFYQKTYLPQPGDSEKTIQTKLNSLKTFFAPIVSYQDNGSFSPSYSDNTALLESLGAR